jgi:hypothetical protein
MEVHYLLLLSSILYMWCQRRNQRLPDSIHLLGLQDRKTILKHKIEEWKTVVDWR